MQTTKFIQTVPYISVPFICLFSFYSFIFNSFVALKSDTEYSQSFLLFMFCIDLTVPIEMYLRCMSTCKILFLFQRSQFPILYILVHCMCKRLMIKFWDLILTNSVCMYKCTCTVYLCRPLSKIFYSNMSVNMYREKNKLII